MYRERPSRVAGAVVWHTVAAALGSEKRVLPDGCMDLIWAGDRLVVAGPDTTAHLSPWPEGTEFAGLRFYPGTAPTILGAAAHELRDQVVELADVWPAARARRLTERVAEAPDRAAVLEDAALRRLAEVETPDPRIRGVVRNVWAGVSVADTADAVGVGERQLHRWCLPVFGYGPKTLARILRMRRALDLARDGVPLATVAATAGYADQAHLTRDVRALAGVPPSALLR